jgi:hypothetical protein
LRRSVALDGVGWWRVEYELGAQQLELVTFDVADRHSAPTRSAARIMVASMSLSAAFSPIVGITLGSTLLFERPLSQIRGAYLEAVDG